MQQSTSFIFISAALRISSKYVVNIISNNICKITLGNFRDKYLHDVMWIFSGTICIYIYIYLTENHVVVNNYYT